MAIKGYYSQNTDYNAEDLRQALTATFPTTACGVLSPTDLVVTTPANGGTVSVSPGRAIMSTTNAGITGGHRFVAHNTGTYNAKNAVGGSTVWSLPAAGNSRVDTVYIRQTDKAIESAANDVADIYFLQGTPVASANAAPSGVPANFQHSVLGYIYSYNSGPVIRVDQSWPGFPGRIVIGAMGGISVSTSGAQPTGGNWDGRAWYTSEDDTLQIHNGSTWSPVVPVGMLAPFAGSTAPVGYLLCQGQALTTTAYPRLFATIGYTYGGAAGTFYVPNLKGRVPVGLDAAQTEFDALNEQNGTKTHTLQLTEIPAHYHGHTETRLSTVAGYLWGQLPGGAPLNEVDEARNTANAGGGGAHNNLQPYIVLNYIIKF